MIWRFQRRQILRCHTTFESSLTKYGYMLLIPAHPVVPATAAAATRGESMKANALYMDVDDKYLGVTLDASFPYCLHSGPVGSLSDEVPSTPSIS